jgi:hypothetical protein
MMTLSPHVAALAALTDALCAARRFTEFAPREQRLRTWVGTVMLRAGIVAFANAAASYHGADVLGLLRDILVQQLDSQPGPAQARPCAVHPHDASCVSLCVPDPASWCATAL